MLLNFFSMDKLLLIFFTAVVLASCDYSMNISVRNYKEACKVKVNYQTDPPPLVNNDTLSLTALTANGTNGSVLRINTVTGEYHFTCPGETEVKLMPVRLGNPITKVAITNKADSVWTIVPGDTKMLRKLKKGGLVKTKGFIFTHSIFIENK